MKRNVAGMLVVWMVLCGMGWAEKAEESEMPPAKPLSPELERIKALAGTWTGTHDAEDGMGEVTVTYAVTAGGSAVLETLFPGAEHEMVSMYHDEGGKLAMTHYCVLGNQPHMGVTSSSDTTIELAMSGTDGIADPKEPHMHGLILTFVDANTIRHAWRHFFDGEETTGVALTLTRKP